MWSREALPTATAGATPNAGMPGAETGDKRPVPFSLTDTRGCGPSREACRRATRGLYVCCARNEAGAPSGRRERAFAGALPASCCWRDASARAFQLNVSASPTSGTGSIVSINVGTRSCRSDEASAEGAAHVPSKGTASTARTSQHGAAGVARVAFGEMEVGGVLMPPFDWIGTTRFFKGKKLPARKQCANATNG